MKRIVTGILAHVDAGKTTLSEALLYATGNVRKLGRVDHGDAFLDTNTMERQRGITIFTEPAIITTPDLTLTLLDTPGHVDFSAEMERTLAVLDYAILVISGADGIQGHTETLWRLLKRYNVPTFIFVNKMDAPAADKTKLLQQLKRRFSDGCIDFTGEQDGDETLANSMEDVAMQSETAMESYLESGTIPDETIQEMIADRALFPCFFGSALKMDGIDEFVAGFERYVREPEYDSAFGARIYKVSHDTQGNRLTWLKVTGGEFKAKTMLSGTERVGADLGESKIGDDGMWHEKADQVRVYSGAKFATVDSVVAGTVCAVTGLTRTFPGAGLGKEHDGANPVLQPVLTYTLLPGECDIHACLVALRELEDEDPLLHVVWQPHLEEVHLQLMGAVQLEVIQQMMHDRFGLDVSFGPGGILYKETIAHPIEGVGHFEPLRHYAETHVLLEPLLAGSGMRFASVCSEDVLDRNWQRLILQHCREREHLGVLTGSPVTDMKITLLVGRAHLKHTEGGDFRQATYRAIRQGLMEAKERGDCRLLEPWYGFRLEVPQDMVGHAMADIQRMSGSFDTPSGDGEYMVLEGEAPVAQMRDYAMDVNAYTHGRGHLSCVFAGYRPCHNADEVIEQSAYDPESDLENTPDSVFCAHGAGYPVKWYKVPEFMHLDYVWHGECM
ncbi:TetM/TetW/TetO/TetS family tetracycline resistance ribosomal protection protein [Bifidobacterium catenulatum]|uniref:elongation factor G n=1 Tax=Bifidobacterium catenulatum TaxID=1686 RepID=UPI00232E93C3|nr:TetM/TetW/TetO/TetS family tetracycline resistance ribosomal protection protein [Bifidobacterium catenulatum]MDB1139973.1 TetM/TetW/TetO/TetS family tetracycline resistance ribosomal protection protein [Bifidobacterium catenulatum]MDB1145647.1 TetM/TetW/TetO/TetS family tetracycline resistance ribosomal protection protein [Bifidobacterium catenulatum]MDB1157663.1 TetM/TetW/TetO/TetS family tetracycline resistance ribosomal protection protein [Bifidobacterium catenulatum]